VRARGGLHACMRVPRAQGCVCCAAMLSLACSQQQTEASPLTHHTHTPCRSTCSDSSSSRRCALAACPSATGECRCACSVNACARARLATCKRTKRWRRQRCCLHPSAPRRGQAGGVRARRPHHRPHPGLPRYRWGCCAAASTSASAASAWCCRAVCVARNNLHTDGAPTRLHADGGWMRIALKNVAGDAALTSVELGHATGQAAEGGTSWWARSRGVCACRLLRPWGPCAVARGMHAEARHAR
jgi:hypothetical protein